MPSDGSSYGRTARGTHRGPRFLHRLCMLLVLSGIGVVTPEWRARAGGWQAIGPASWPVYSLAFSADRSSLYATTDSGIVLLRAGSDWQFAKENFCIDWPIGNECFSYLKIYRHPLFAHLWFVGWSDSWIETETYISRMNDPAGVWEDTRGYARSLSAIALGFNMQNPAIVYGNLDGFVRSDDTGKTWTYPAGQAAFRRSRFIASDTRRQSTLYTVGAPTATSFFGIYKSTDNGSHWAMAYRDSFGYEVSYAAGLAQGDTIVIGLESASSSTETGILYSPDGGATWRKVLRGTSISAIARDGSRANYLYAGSVGALYFSGNGGFSWEPWNTTLPRDAITDINSDPGSDTVYVATSGSGIFKVFDYSTDIAAPSREHPSSYVLRPLYPNPFNPSTTVEITLPERGMVTIDVFDVLGQRVGRIADEAAGAGVHTYRFDGEGLPSGMYLVRAILDGRVFVRSVVLLR